MSVPVRALFETATPQLKQMRQASIAKTLGTHPHVCLTCPQREGCSRTTCSYGNPVETRCCSIFNNCELRKVADYVGIPNTTPPYKPASLPVVKDEPFFDRDYNLCIDCRRCLTACNDLRGVGCLEGDDQAAVCVDTPPAASSNALETSRMLMTPASEKSSMTGRWRM